MKDGSRKKIILSFSLIVMMLYPVTLMAETISPVGVSLLNPMQAPVQDASVRGIRINILYARHNSLTGLDLGTGINRLDGSLAGFQFGLYNNVSQRTLGLQMGGVNVTDDSLSGIQFGLMNLTREAMTGAQIGITNKAHRVDGIQVGLWNTTFILSGVQIGLVNMKQDSLQTFPSSVPYRIVPLINWTF